MKTHAAAKKQSAMGHRPSGPMTGGRFGPARGGDEARIRHILRSLPVQRKLTVGAPDDVYEQEADRVADEVMRMPDRIDALARRRTDEEEPASDVPVARGQLAEPRVQRSPDKRDRLEAYLEFLRQNRRIEGRKTSKALALEMVEKGIRTTGSEYFLPDALQYLLIAELLRGGTTRAQRDGILEVLERMGEFSLKQVFLPGHVDVQNLAAEYRGAELTRLEDFFNRRFEGGLKQIKAGTIKIRGEYIPPGIPLASLDLVRKTLKWLKSNKKTAAAFFAGSWSANKIILLGEIHFDDVQRMFAGDMLKAHGGGDAGLALEIHVSLQHEVDYYVKHGRLPKDAKGWWRHDKHFKKLLDQARATKTQVIAMDTAARSDRDQHMAEEVKKLARGKKKILVYVGAEHIKEAQTGALGQRLATEFGGRSYAVDMFHPDKADYIYWMIKETFPGETSLGFDIDRSPLKKHLYPDILSAKYTFGENLDGYLYFHSTSSYK
ncbi:MAG: hypothetical protein ACOWWM_13510 [Desulfobacterales bacterium]